MINGVFSPPTNESNYQIQYKYMSLDGCADSVQKIATIINVPEAPITSDTIRYCQNVTTLPVPLAIADPGNTILWYSNDSTQLPGIPGLSRITGERNFLVTQKNELCESPFSLMTVVADSTPVAPVVSNLGPVCAGDEKTIYTEGLPNSTFTWQVETGLVSLVQSNTLGSVTFNISDIAVKGRVSELTSAGCASDTTEFTIQVDLHPSNALVSGSDSDTLRFCISAPEKQLTGNYPHIGTGKWNIISNTGSTTFDTAIPDSFLTDFSDIKDTLVAEWVISNGVCPDKKAILSVHPEPAYYPEVDIQGLNNVCEGTEVTLQAVVGAASGNNPRFYFYGNGL